MQAHLVLTGQSAVAEINEKTLISEIGRTEEGASHIRYPEIMMRRVVVGERDQ